MWFQEKSWTELRSSFDSNHFDNSRRKTLWNALWLQGKFILQNSQPLRMPFDCAPSWVKPLLWENKTQHHVCLSVCSLTLGFMLHLKCSSPFQLTGVSAQLLDRPVLTQEVKNASTRLWAPPWQSCSSFLQTPDNPKRGVTFCCHAEGWLKPLCKTDGLDGKRNRYDWCLGWLLLPLDQVKVPRTQSWVH